MTYSVLDQNGKVVAGDAAFDDALREAADRYPGGKIRDNSTRQIVYESDDEERPALTLKEAMERFGDEEARGVAASMDQPDDAA